MFSYSSRRSLRTNAMVSMTAMRKASPTVSETKKKWKMLVEAN